MHDWSMGKDVLVFIHMVKVPVDEVFINRQCMARAKTRLAVMHSGKFLTYFLVLLPQELFLPVGTALGRFLHV